MTNFDDLLQSLHNGAGAELVDDSAAIVINERRQFEIPADYNTIIAFEGDVNSQIITFEIPKKHEGHELSKCKYKQLRWKNLTSGLEGKSTLRIINSENNQYGWEVPSDAFTQAGTLEIAITFYDLDDDFKLAFSWNTPSYTGLSVGKTMETVSTTIFPPKNEILFIDKESKNIVAPKGYNNVVCNYGDVGVANVYFLVNQYLGKGDTIDVLDENVDITIYVIMNGYKKKQVLTSKVPYTSVIEDRNNEGLVFIDWAIPPQLTAGECGANTMQISLEFTESEYKNSEKVIVKRWFTNAYSQLKVAPSMIEIETEPGTPPLTDNKIYQLIDSYFEINDIVWTADKE